MNAVEMLGHIIKEIAEATADIDSYGCVKFVAFCNAPDDNPFMAGGFLAAAGADERDRRDGDALVDDRDAEVAFDRFAGGHEADLHQDAPRLNARERKGRTMLNIMEVHETNQMIEQEKLDVRTITMGTLSAAGSERMSSSSAGVIDFETSAE